MELADVLNMGYRASENALGMKASFISSGLQAGHPTEFSLR